MRVSTLALASAVVVGNVLTAQPVAAAVCGSDSNITICKELTGTGPEATHYSGPYSKPDGAYSILEYVYNGSGAAWREYHIGLQSFNPQTGQWEDSDGLDSVSFSGSSLAVDVDFDEQTTGWTGIVTGAPYDTIEFVFAGFHILPGQTLTLNFTVSDFTDREWRLTQYATHAPLPGAAVLFGSALAGLALVRRRQPV